MSNVSFVEYNGKFYPAPLGNLLAGTDLNGDDSLEMIYNFNSALLIDGESPWYTGTDQNVPENKFDVVTIALHEITHGLGWLKSFRVQNFGIDVGVWGKPGENGFVPLIFDTFVDDGVFTLLDAEVYPFMSTKLCNAYKSDHLYFAGNEAKAVNNGDKPKLYSPSLWVETSSINHLDLKTYGTYKNPNHLMIPGLWPNVSIYEPGPIVFGSLQDMGLNINRVITITSPAANVNLVKNGKYSINWTDTRSGRIRIDIVPENNSLDYTVIDSVLSKKGDNTYTWEIYQALSEGRYKIRISDISENISFSEPFKITVPSSQSVVLNPYPKPVSGRYFPFVKIGLNCQTSGAEIWYTIDGTTPENKVTASSKKYTDSIKISSTTTIKIRAFKNSYIPSDVMDYKYEITPYIKPVIIYQMSKEPNGGYSFAFGDVGAWVDGKWDFNNS